MLLIANYKSAGRVSSVIVVLFISLLYLTPQPAEARLSLSDLQNQIDNQQLLLGVLVDSACSEGSVMHGVGVDGSIICTEIEPEEEEILHVFVSSQYYTANLGGVAGADAKCQALADASTLPSAIYKAWISDSNYDSSPSQRFTGIPHRRAYVLADGTTLVATSWADLLDGTLVHSIDQTEQGDLRTGSVWTNTNISGQPTFDYAKWSCSDWTSDVNHIYYHASTGHITTNTDWTFMRGGIQTACWMNQRLYCFEQP